MWQKIELNYETYIKDIAGQSHEGRLLEIIVYIRSIYKWKAQKKNIENKSDPVLWYIHIKNFYRIKSEVIQIYKSIYF